MPPFEEVSLVGQLSHQYETLKCLTKSLSKVLIEKRGNTMSVTLNRPKALNSLNLEMVRILTPLYTVRIGKPYISRFMLDISLPVSRKLSSSGRDFCRILKVNCTPFLTSIGSLLILPSNGIQTRLFLISS